MKTNRRIRVMELFAGVGGFRIGLDRANKELAKEHAGEQMPEYELVWSNQWEPGEARQWASKVYVERFGESGHSNEDISKVKASEIPDADLLVGGFPCQDYSVARTLNQAFGIVGKKGVLWWEIHRIVSEKRPRYLLLENVDRMLKSPVSRRGRDFAIILSALNALGYVVEWKVVNAADYGFPQRRRRVFMLAYRDDSPIARRVGRAPLDWITESGVLATALHSTFEASDLPLIPLEIGLDAARVSDHFAEKGGKTSPFKNVGVAVAGRVYTAHGAPNYSGRRLKLKDVLAKDETVPAEFRIPNEELPKWRAAKGAKSLERTRKDGVTYTYDEGSMSFPDPIDRPSRTIVTGEGGRTPSRFKHVVQFGKRGYRRLMPVELEKLNGFPRNHTRLEGVTDGRRAFFMGNALVTGVVTLIAKSLAEHGAGKEADESVGTHVKNPRTRKPVDRTKSGDALSSAPDQGLA